eukprot:766901-Rhodomonas_salina.3
MLCGRNAHLKVPVDEFRHWPGMRGGSETEGRWQCAKQGHLTLNTCNTISERVQGEWHGPSHVIPPRDSGRHVTSSLVLPLGI